MPIKSKAPRPQEFAAVDLGSNSFHLQVGRVVEDQIYPLDTLKETVRLASGLTAEKMLSEATQDRALETLCRFGERLRGFQPDSVRAVATNTLRVAKNAAAFLVSSAVFFAVFLVASAAAFAPPFFAAFAYWRFICCFCMKRESGLEVSCGLSCRVL